MYNVCFKYIVFIKLYVDHERSIKTFLFKSEKDYNSTVELECSKWFHFTVDKIVMLLYKTYHVQNQIVPNK